ncbi:MAG: class I SAM-dependent methyltransferase [Sedimentisphaerales bacterium]|nr:class I SAM-dependent methyltransferase [Sedimentisphaerales bacterium]
MLDWLRLPETKNIADLDDPATTLLHAKIVRQKPFLKNTYLGFYSEFQTAFADTKGKTLVELGSGGGFLKEILPDVITSDVLEITTVDKVFSALAMPFADASVDAFFMVDVLHHIPDAERFFREALRCLKSGGKIIMVEPANTPFGRFIYKNFHHEQFDPAGKWHLEATGPLSVANGAIPWIVFSRDRKIFESKFPTLKILRIEPHTPFRYLISGGLSLRQLLPSFMYPVVKGIEFILTPLNPLIGMFQTIELKKQ